MNPAAPLKPDQLAEIVPRMPPTNPDARVRARSSARATIPAHSVPWVHPPMSTPGPCGAPARTTTIGRPSSEMPSRRALVLTIDGSAGGLPRGACAPLGLVVAARGAAAVEAHPARSAAPRRAPIRAVVFTPPAIRLPGGSGVADLLSRTRRSLIETEASQGERAVGVLRDPDAVVADADREVLVGSTCQIAAVCLIG